MNVETKKCIQCGSIKYLSLFHACCPTRTKEQDCKIYYSKECKSCRSLNDKANRHILREREFVNRLKSDYGITLDDYNKMYVEQEGKCDICKIQCKKTGKKSERMTTFNIDHDHITGNVRALLCNRCNMVLGSVNDDVELFNKMVKYLNKHKRN